MLDRDDDDDDDEVYGRYEIVWTIQQPIAPSDDPDEYVTEFEGSILHCTESDPDVGTLIGTVTGRIIEAARAAAAGEELFDVCDSVDQSLHDYYCALYDDNDLKETVSDGSIGSDALIVESIEVLPEHRGQELGLFSLLRTIDQLGRGCAVVAIRPYPLQFDSSYCRRTSSWHAQMKVNQFKSDELTAMKKLRSYWGRLGFVRLPETDYFILNLQHPRPDFADLAEQ